MDLGWLDAVHGQEAEIELRIVDDDAELVETLQDGRSGAEQVDHRNAPAAAIELQQSDVGAMRVEARAAGVFQVGLDLPELPLLRGDPGRIGLGPAQPGKRSPALAVASRSWRSRAASAGLGAVSSRSRSIRRRHRRRFR